ncbi:MAG: hypothetical protein K2X66_05040, partial [Cyanobacteria bacterium]|nr:hypothetical protein [Cyanobacteriota bacterium]
MQSIPRVFTSTHSAFIPHHVSKALAQKLSSPTLSAHVPLADTFIPLHFGADEEKPTPASGDESGAKIPKSNPADSTFTPSTPEKGIDKLKKVFAGTVFGQEDAKASLLKYAEAAAKAKKKYPKEKKPPIIVFTSPLAMGAGKSSMLALFPFLTKKIAEAGETNPPIPESSFETLLKNIDKKEPPKTSLNPVKALDEIDAEMSKPVILSDAFITALGLDGKGSTTLPAGMSAATGMPIASFSSGKDPFSISEGFDIYAPIVTDDSFTLTDDEPIGTFAPPLSLLMAFAVNAQPLPPSIDPLRNGLLNGQDVSQSFIQAMPDLLLNQPLNVIHGLSKAVETFFDRNHYFQKSHQKSHANEAELLLLLNHPELWDRDPKKTKQITEALTS